MSVHVRVQSQSVDQVPGDAKNNPKMWLGTLGEIRKYQARVSYRIVTS